MSNDDDDDDDVSNRDAELDFCSASSLKQQSSAGRYVDLI